GVPHSPPPRGAARGGGNGGRRPGPHGGRLPGHARRRQHGQDDRQGIACRGKALRGRAKTPFPGPRHTSRGQDALPRAATIGGRRSGVVRIEAYFRDLRTTFDRAAATYQDARPDYPAELYSDLLAITGVTPSAHQVSR